MEHVGNRGAQIDSSLVDGVTPIKSKHERKFSHPFGSPLLGFAGNSYDSRL